MVILQVPAGTSFSDNLHGCWSIQKFLEDSEKERENKNYDDMWPTSSESEAESEEGGWWRML